MRFWGVTATVCWMSFGRREESDKLAVRCSGEKVWRPHCVTWKLASLGFVWLFWRFRTFLRVFCYVPAAKRNATGLVDGGSTTCRRRSSTWQSKVGFRPLREGI